MAKLPLLDLARDRLNINLPYEQQNDDEWNNFVAEARYHVVPPCLQFLTLNTRHASKNLCGVQNMRTLGLSPPICGGTFTKAQVTEKDSLVRRRASPLTHTTHTTRTIAVIVDHVIQHSPSLGSLQTKANFETSHNVL